MKQRKRQKGIITILTILILAMVMVIGYGYIQMEGLKEANDLMSQEMTSNKQTVYVATRLIERGEKIISSGEDANVELQNVYTGLEAYNYITEEQIGDIATVDISAGVPIMYVMVTEKTITNDSREFEISAVNLTTDQNEYDMVDVRIMFPDGSDYVVLSKKEITQLDLTNCIFTTVLNEEEILRYICAMIDAYTVPGARLYTTRYVESALQEAATPNYPVKEATRLLIQSNPNVVSSAADTLNAQARADLEKRLGLLTAEMLDEIEKGLQDDQSDVENAINEDNITE